MGEALRVVGGFCFNLWTLNDNSPQWKSSERCGLRGIGHSWLQKYLSALCSPQHSRTSVISNIMLQKSSSWEAAWLCQPLLVETTSFFFFISKHKKQQEFWVRLLEMPGNIHPTFYSCLSQEDFLQMQHKYVQAIILTHVGPLAYPLSWTLASHVGVRKETKLFLFGGRESEAPRYQIHDLCLWLESFRLQNLNLVHHQPPTLSSSNRVIQKVEIVGQEIVCCCC